MFKFIKLKQKKWQRNFLSLLLMISFYCLRSNNLKNFMKKKNDMMYHYMFDILKHIFFDVILLLYFLYFWSFPVYQSFWFSLFILVTLVSQQWQMDLLFIQDNRWRPHPLPLPHPDPPPQCLSASLPGPRDCCTQRPISGE